MNISVTILSFSSRKNGNCAAIGEFISKYYDHTNYFVIDGEAVKSCGNCDYECLKSGVVCPRLTKAYQQIMDSVSTSDLVYFIVPNYCGYPCANYFAFNERSVGYFNMDREKMRQYMKVPKRFIIVSNTEGFESAMHQQTNDTPETLYLKTRKYGKQSIAGDLLESDEAKADLDAFLRQERL